jgi:AraC family transcriptional regulator, carnitine catabolism transcriptional activator
LPRRLIALMEQNLDFPLTLPELSQRLGVSRRTLERHCLQHFGQTPSQLYLRVRLQAARNFLFYEELNVKAVAIACGFSYPAVFSRAFRKQFGQAPSQFRDSFRSLQASRVRPEIQRLSRSSLAG